MPYKARTRNQIELHRLLKAYGLNATTLSKVIGCTYPTAKKKLEDPGLLTVNELMMISSKGHIAIDLVRGAIG